MNLRFPILLLASLAALFPAMACADTGVAMSGFATLGAVHSHRSEADFVASLTQPNGAGRTQPVALGVDTKGGVQAALTMDNGLSGVFQVVADHRANNTYTTQVEWANLKYQFTPDTYMRAGRVVAPVFMVSVYRNVGYAQVPVRQSWDVYSLNPLSHLDGADVGTRVDLGGGILSGQLTAGHVEATLAPAAYKGKAALGNLSYEHGATTVRAGYGKYRLDFRVTDPSLPVDLYQQVIDAGFAAQALSYPAANLKLTGIDMTMWGLGYQYEPGDWFMQGEYVRRRADGTLIQNVAAWYVLAGLRIDKFKPYVSYAGIRSIQPPLNPPAHPPYSCAGWTLGSDLLCDASYLINTIDAVSNQRIVQHTWSLGVRYDFLEKAALKLQFDRITKPGDSGSQTIGQFPVTPPGGWSNDWVYNRKRVDVWSATLDFIF